MAMLHNRRKTASTVTAAPRWNRIVLSLGTQGALLAAVATGVGAIAYHVNGRMTPDPVLQALTGSAARAANAKTETFILSALKTQQPSPVATLAAVSAALPPAANSVGPISDAAALPIQTPAVVAAPVEPPVAIQTATQIVVLPASVNPDLPPAPVLASTRDAGPIAVNLPKSEATSQAFEPASALPSISSVITAAPAAVAAAVSILANRSPASQAAPAADLPNAAIEAARQRATQAEWEALAAARASRAIDERRAAELAEARARAAERIQVEARVQARADETARKAAARRAEDKREAAEQAQKVSQKQAQAGAEEKSRVAAAERRERADAEGRSAAKRAEATKEAAQSAAQRERFEAALAERNRHAAPRKTVGVQIALNTKCAAMPLTRNWIGGVMFRSGYRSC